MFWVLLALLVGVVWLESSLVAGVLVALAMMFLMFFLLILRELIDMIRYRDEYIRCIEAIRGEDDERIDHVNLINRHFYVGRAFRCSSGPDGLDVGYHYSIQVRPKEGGGGGGFDAMPLFFS
jgi:hypothetical protein